MSAREADSLPAGGAVSPALPRIIVFAKVPRLGQVKTRLARVLGEARALQAYRELLGHTLRVVGSMQGFERELCITGDDDSGEGAALAREYGLCLSTQQGADLGQRMATALQRTVSEGRAVLLVGADCPVLEPSDFDQALDALQRVDAVFSPTLDGGYALVGAARRVPPVFEGIDWSTDAVMSQTVRRLNDAGFGFRLLRSVWDVDEYEDWLRWEALRG